MTSPPRFGLDETMWPLKTRVGTRRVSKKTLKGNPPGLRFSSWQSSLYFACEKMWAAPLSSDVLVTFFGKFLAINATKLSHLSQNSNYCQRSTLSITLSDGGGYVVGFVFLTSGNNITVQVSTWRCNIMIQHATYLI
jgi:hypothetical protein